MDRRRTGTICTPLCSVAVVVLQQSPEPFTTLHRALALCVLVDRWKKPHVALALMIRCCASKPGKPVLELCLAHLPNRGDARWKLSDNGAIKNLVQIGVK